MLEKFFVSVFAVELLLRMVVLYRTFFGVALNYVDVVVVALGLVEWIAVGAIGSAIDPKLLRILRFARVGRALRVLRLATWLPSKLFLFRYGVFPVMFCCVFYLFWSFSGMSGI